MSCYTPLKAWYSKDIGASGKRGITFKRDRAFFGVDKPLMLPCGQCTGCRLKYSKDWAVRCMHEKLSFEQNVFVTLTYDDDHLPSDWSLVKRDLQLFMKRLRKMKGPGVRFFACGEYGETTYRPHYHVLLFNCDFDDKRFYKKTQKGFDLYVSDQVGELWPSGFNVLGSVNFESCAYVARYIMAKRNGEQSEKFYLWTDADGVIHERIKEFVVMSRRPGLGAAWFEKYGPHAFHFDSAIMEGREVGLSRFYDNRMELIDDELLAAVKVKRKRKAIARASDNTPSRLRVRERVQQLSMAVWKRDLRT